MWKVLLLVIMIALTAWYVNRKHQVEKSKGRDRTGELLEDKHIKDTFGKDILDLECSRIQKLI
jgi:hypothetical protein